MYVDYNIKNIAPLELELRFYTKSMVIHNTILSLQAQFIPLLIGVD